MNCPEFEILLSDYVDGTISVEDRRAIEAHADSCASCRDYLRDVFQAVAFIDKAEEIKPPAELVTRIVFNAPRGRVRQDWERRGFFSRAFSNWFRPVLQPRFAMGMAMTILSFAMLGKCTGVHVQEIKPADLNPAKLWAGVEDKAYRSWDRSVKYYDNLRLVYEIRTRLKEVRDQQDSAGSATPSQNGAPATSQDSNGGTKK